MRENRPCAHPGCDRSATEVAVVGSDWEDSSSGSGLLLCQDHAAAYAADAAGRGTMRAGGAGTRRGPTAGTPTG